MNETKKCAQAPIRSLVLLIGAFSSLITLANDSSSYQMWKQSVMQEWDQTNKTEKVERSNDLIAPLAQWLHDHELHDSVLCPTLKGDNLEIVFTYNLLAELWHMSPITDAHEIDREMLEKIEEMKIIEDREYTPASLNQKKLVDDALQVFALKHEVLTLQNKGLFDAHVGTTSFDKPFIALCKTHDVDVNSFIIYHELSHFVHDDTLLKNQLNEKPAAEFLNQPEFKAHLERINKYLELGKKAFDASLPIGRRFKRILSENALFWIVPEDKEAYEQMVVLRSTEQRADLLACEKLLEQNKLPSVLRVIDLYSNQEGYWSIVALGDTYIHPSAFERALYMTGFLVEQGVDVNAAFKDWRETGECSAFLESYALEII